MNEFMMGTQVQRIHSFLEEVIIQLEEYLNSVTIHTLLKEKPGDRVYYEGLFSNLRRLVVYCEEGLDASASVLQHDSFKMDLAEKVLYKIYHKCIIEYYSPRYNLWFEDLRTSYPEESVIRFRQEPPDCFAELLRNVEGDFHGAREDLAEFETEYRHRRLSSKG
ncbi:DUF3907 family protein [Rossellomorea sp. YZS02]|uniref:DUF3907 family protein n=1 Tax=Rossellomorea sp. YZS02 TaxID=3097358 RepID=UPI002A0C0860|nr:DUF3907 family protein [Rossellomorea sp. YZS02]MDX8345490.1 DUF3907 family protein [Rossellomorea sp. YZS02]